jgi:hypothetical protein
MVPGAAVHLTSPVSQGEGDGGGEEEAASVHR